MRKLVSTVAVFIAFGAQLANAKSYIVTADGVSVKKGPGTSEPALLRMDKGRVIEGTEEGGWVRSEMGNMGIGFISTRFLMPTDKNIGVNKSNTVPKLSKKLRNTPTSVVDLTTSLRTIKITPALPTENFKNIVAERDALVAQTQKLSEENKRLSADAAKASAELNAVKSALEAVKGQLATVQRRPLPIPEDNRKSYLSLADKGEAVFFKGIGEALMTTSDGKTVLRFPFAVADKADHVLMGPETERNLQGVFIYYRLDSKLLGL